MTFETFLALIGLAIASLFTPGPNNAMLAASGANHGFRRTIPHGLGVVTGFPLMLLIVGLALGGLFQASEILRETLRWGGAALLLWLAWKIAISGGKETKSKSLPPMTYLAAVGFQWINPKAWSMAIAATSQFIAPEKPLLTAGIVTLTFLTLGLASSSTWIAAGQAISGWLTTPARRHTFNLVMAALIIWSTLALLRH